jgi:Flp pilus assembly protein TadG
MRAVMRKTTELGKNDRGTTVVEFALVLPIFALLLMGIIDFGRYYFVQHTVQYATREGTRLGLVGGTVEGYEGDRTGSIMQKIKDNAGIAIDPAELSISIFPITGYTDPDGWENTQNAGGPGDFMRVRTKYTYQFLTPFIGDFFSNGRNDILAEATYRNELFD